MVYPIFDKEFPITSAYGWRTNPFTKLVEFHDGTDFSTSMGENQKTPDHGYVRRARVDDYGGLWTQIVLDTGYAIEFVHCSRFLVSEGSRVKPGQVISLSGNSGLSTAPHTHFRVLEDYRGRNSHVDPIKFLEDNYSMGLTCQAKLVAANTKNAFLRAEIAKKDERITLANEKASFLTSEIKDLQSQRDAFRNEVISLRKQLESCDSSAKVEELQRKIDEALKSLM